VHRPARPRPRLRRAALPLELQQHIRQRHIPLVAYVSDQHSLSFATVVQPRKRGTMKHENGWSGASIWTLPSPCDILALVSLQVVFFILVLRACATV
jgi:hypothetical protein